MKAHIISTTAALLLAASAAAQGLEAQCREIAKREYPTDSQMQRFTYEQQLAAART